ncbi:hemicentin-1 isoform X2 [Contarinia nasturtii]|uniref:hemicentin-1 isoform X2 n=1 Tax=Contarinia nasturtii TaxID=265458 RepID=UPI0012D4A564|nr:hemicentin-1 isoform X2 [Contarinia nasturtii]
MKKMMSSTVKMQHQHHYHRKSISQHRFVAVILTLIGLLHGVHCEIDETLSIARGSTVPLECPIDIQSCGSLHSLKWFRGNDRVALVPGDGGTPNVDGPYRGRITIDPDGSHTKLYIKSVQVHDEDTYKCVVTYSDPLDSCESKGLYIIKLNVLVEPSTMQMQDETGQILQNETVVGPLIENERFVSYCEARMGRPRPNVGWYLHGKRLPESISTSEGPDANGLFTEKAMLSMILTRKEMAATFECRIESEALQTIKRYQLKVDLQVRPRKVEVSGVRTHTVQGSTVSLLCKVFGARPAANVTWYNNTTPLRLDGPHTINEKSEEISDTTFTTYSQLSFTATRYENGVNFRCEADNIVMQNELEKPLSNFLYLTVMYPPVVTVSPSNLLVTENGDIYLDCRYDSNPSSLKRVTWKRNGVPLVVDGHRMGGGNVESIGLKIQQVLRTDLGNYTCELQNEYGIGVSDNSISLDVHYPPVVELLMEPDTPIIEHDAVNVTLICRIISGNPATLSRVTWYLDGGILKELPECNGGSDDALCGVDPDILLLENVGRHFLGNYSCEGQNTAGGGNRSVDRELIVYYEPGKATLLHYPLVTSKKKSVTLFCSVEDGGNPNATQYKWLRSGSVLQYDTAMITLENLGLESRTNFTCYAYNKGGIGQSATIALDVLAPPAFIKALQPRTAALFSTQNISLSCRVECVPLCTITWYKNGIGIEKYDERYVITDTFLPADKAIGDFESVLSTLHFNISAWPKQQLDIHQDNANYSCVSSANSEGPGVRSSTVFHVEYPPENTTVSNVTVDVIEGNSPPRITCAGNAYPPLQYQWIRNGTVIDGSLLQIHKPMTREDAGIYECVSRNKHGTQSASIEINILYKPDCTITRREINDEDTLVCTANGNPAKMSFEWTVKMENETEIMPESSTDDSDTVSLLTINDDKGRTYRCIANNSVGIGTMCNIEITVWPKRQYHWWQHWNTNPMIIIIAAVTALLLMVIIICCIIICICRKRRQRDKYHTDVSISATHSVLSAQATADSPASRSCAPEIPKSPPKWPLRPGVLVHVKCDTKQNLCANRAQSPFNASTLNTSGNLNNVSYASPLLSTNSRNTSMTSGKVGSGSTNLSSTPITLPELPARNTKTNSTVIAITTTPTTNVSGATDSTTNNSKKTTKSVARALLIDEDGITAKVESDDSSKEDGGNRITIPTTNNTNNNNNSTVIGSVDTTTGLLQNTVTVTTSEPNNDELLRFTSSNLIERILGRLRWRREQSTNNNAHNGTNNEDGILAKSNKRAVSLLRATGWFGSGKSTNSTTGLMSDTTKNQINGITCSESVVTYKRTPVTLRPISISDSLTDSIESRKQNSSSSPRGKSSLGADLLTDPGEYENLPFHGLQTAPNKPLGADNFPGDFDYADVDFHNYGPINYKAASIYALVKKNKNGNLTEIRK